MSIWELVLLGLLGARALAVWLRGEGGAIARGLAATAAGAAWVAHLALDGPRWPMAPAYAGVALAVALLPWERPHPKAVLLRLGRNRRQRRPVPWARALLAGVAWLIAAALPWLLPLPVLPAPSGPWRVGSVSFPLALPDAVLPGGEVEVDRRTMVRLWYPVEPATAPAADAPWIERADVVLPAMAAAGGLPPIAFHHLRRVRTHAAWAAPLAPPPDDRGWPLATFDHGLGGFRSQNTFLVEELASHGFVVAALDHPGDALGTTLPDGERLPYRGLPPADAAGYVEAVVALGARWVADTTALLATLGALEPSGELAAFAGALDLGRVLTLGHSAGGGVAAEVCRAWEGCRATLALDPWWAPLDPARLEAGAVRPLAVVVSDPALGYFGPGNAERFARYAAAATAPVGAWLLEGGGHHDVNDTMGLSPIAGRLGHSVGPVDKTAAMAAVRSLAKVLAGLAAANDDTPSPAAGPPSATAAWRAALRDAAPPPLAAFEPAR